MIGLHSLKSHPHQNPCQRHAAGRYMHRWRYLLSELAWSGVPDIYRSRVFSRNMVAIHSGRSSCSCALDSLFHELRPFVSRWRQSVLRG